MVDGGFDPLHSGHVEYIRQAAALGLPVLCSVVGDHYVASKHPPLLPAERRVLVLDALRDVAHTYLNRGTTEEVLRELRPRFYVKGNDWEGRLPESQVVACRELGIEIVFVDTVRDSSQRLLRDFTTACQSVDDFEDLVLAQRPVSAGHYDGEYFTGDWRTQGNKYTLEARRAIEGRTPQLIREVFSPARVLDFGCGPGILMALLDELGVSADGLDFSPRSRELAPERVRDRILAGRVTEPVVAEGSYDLVVCREVLEHLTILEVRRAVQQMVRATSRFVYLTTRFHPAPLGLLAVTHERDVDPSHITLLNKDLLRSLLVLEGCRRRADLEVRMDWLGKGRVLVYEKVRT
jgi:D-beta-D-heptose 7-phosphate kinase/D-beta-D-heptose 1-phosphate adenosyltransferase